MQDGNVSDQLVTLNTLYAIPDRVKFESGNGGLPKLVLSTPEAKAEVYLQGACLTHFQQYDKQPVIFCSQTSKYEPGKAIRGGVPIVFPWFGPHPSDSTQPQHGFARLALWNVEQSRQNPDGSVSVTLLLESSTPPSAVWPFEFALRYTVTVGSQLDLALEVTNTSAQPITFEEALHTYFTVSDVKTAAITGLEGTAYIDKVAGGTRKQEGTSPVRLQGETDRIYLATGGPYTIHDLQYGEIVVEKANSGLHHRLEPLGDKGGKDG